jgi:hypothetical protein
MTNPTDYLQTTVSVFTRHSSDCPKRDDRNWKRCRCRKWLYIFEAGQDRRMTAGTRSWEQTELVARAERDRRDPVKMKLQEIKDHEAQVTAAQRSQSITIADATGRWIAAQKFESEHTAEIYGRAAKRIRTWASSQSRENLSDVTADMLDLWRGQWAEDAPDRNNRLRRTSQSQFLSYLKRFFRVAVRIGFINTRRPLVGSGLNRLRGRPHQGLTPPLERPAQESCRRCRALRIGRREVEA